MTKKIGPFLPEKSGIWVKQLLVEVEFGVPSRGCVNYGICRIEVAGEPVRRHRMRCKGGYGQALASAPGENVLRLDFLRTSLSGQAVQRHFEGGFLVEEAYALPACVRQQLGIPPAIIESGWYRVLENRTYFIVYFNLINL